MTQRLRRLPRGNGEIMIFTDLICSILESVLAAFSNSPFFGFIAGILNSLLAAFGCGISPG